MGKRTFVRRTALKYFRQTLAASLVSIASTFLLALPCNADDRPNIVVFLCDDLGYGDLQCYGHPHIKTPNIDKLAKDGIRFTDFYSAAPVCSPSRVGLLTGRSPNRAGVYDWIPPAGKPRPDAREQVHMQRDEITIPAILQKAGYATCMAGKWHCNSRFNEPDAQPQPNDFGFEHWLGTQNNAAPSHENPTNFVRNGKPVGKVDSFSCQYVVDEAIDWMSNQAKTNAEQPLFIYIPFHEPHEPVASPQNLVDQYRESARNNDEAQFFANVANVDLAVGRLLKSLDELKLTANTLVIFTADNGPETLNRYRGAQRSYGRPGKLRGMKLHTHEAGFRVAGIMRWPERITVGQVVSTPVSSLDFLPTFCDLAGAELPQRKLDGANFLPALSGRPIERGQPLFWSYFNAINEARVAMRDGEWKVLARLNGGNLPKFENITTQRRELILQAELTDLEIYNIASDVSEETNLADQQPELAARMKEKLQRLYQELHENSVVWKPAVIDGN